MVHLVEAFRRYLGWCPGRSTTRIRKRILWNGMALPVSPAGHDYTETGTVVDCGKTGISLRFFIGALLGAGGMIALYIHILPAILEIPARSVIFTAGILFCPLILSAAIVMLYRDRKGATLEISRDALTIRRFLRRPVVIRIDAIEKTEIRKYTPPVPSWFLSVMAFFLIPVSSAGIMGGEYLQLAAGEIAASSFVGRLAFNISIVLFFIVIYLHSRIRSKYPEILAITTVSRQIAVIYGNHPEEIAGKLGRSP